VSRTSRKKDEREEEVKAAKGVIKSSCAAHWKEAPREALSLSLPFPLSFSLAISIYTDYHWAADRGKVS
jgi:hypothetical protein